MITSAGYAAFSQLFKNTTFDNTSTKRRVALVVEVMKLLHQDKRCPNAQDESIVQWLIWETSLKSDLLGNPNVWLQFVGVHVQSEAHNGVMDVKVSQREGSF